MLSYGALSTLFEMLLSLFDVFGALLFSSGLRGLVVLRSCKRRPPFAGKSDSDILRRIHRHARGRDSGGRGAGIFDGDRWQNVSKECKSFIEALDDDVLAVVSVLLPESTWYGLSCNRKKAVSVSYLGPADHEQSASRLQQDRLLADYDDNACKQIMTRAIASRSRREKLQAHCKESWKARRLGHWDQIEVSGFRVRPLWF